MIRIAFRKDGSAAFVPPMDYADETPLEATAALVRASIAPFANAWTEQEISRGVEGAARFGTARLAAILAAQRSASAGFIRRTLRPITRPLANAIGLRQWPFK
jgi:hypothetical protein